MTQLKLNFKFHRLVCKARDNHESGYLILARMFPSIVESGLRFRCRSERRPGTLLSIYGDQKAA